MKVTQLEGGRARIQGSLTPKAMLFTTLLAFTHKMLLVQQPFLWGTPISGLTLASEVDMRPRPGNEVFHSHSLSDWFSREHGSQARPGSVLTWDSPARSSGNKGLSLSRKVAEWLIA